MYLFAGVIFGIILSIYIKSYLLVGIILLITSAYILSLKDRYKFLYLPLVILFVFINFNFRDYSLKAFDGQVMGKVILSNENKSIIKTESLNRKKLRLRS